MAKEKTRLTLVEPSATDVAPPPTLGPAGRQLWASVHAEIVLADAGGLALLAQICAATDRAQALAEAIERYGATLRGRSGNVRVHPAIRAELSLRAFFSRGLAWPARRPGQVHRPATRMLICRRTEPR
jgi:hypothetical protein